MQPGAAHIFRRQADALHQVAGDDGGKPDDVLEDAVTVLVEMRFVVRLDLAFGDVEKAEIRSQGRRPLVLDMRAQNVPAARTAVIGLHDHRRRRVAEDKMNFAARMHIDAGHQFGRADQDAPGLSGADHRVGNVQPVERRRAGHGEVEGKAGGADRVLDFARQARKIALLGRGRDDHPVNVLAFIAGSLEGGAGRTQRKLGLDRKLPDRSRCNCGHHAVDVQYAVFLVDMAALDAGCGDDEVRTRQGHRLDRSGSNGFGVGLVEAVCIRVVAGDEFVIVDDVGRSPIAGRPDEAVLHGSRLFPSRIDFSVNHGGRRSNVSRTPVRTGAPKSSTCAHLCSAFRTNAGFAAREVDSPEIRRLALGKIGTSKKTVRRRLSWTVGTTPGS